MINFLNVDKATLQKLPEVKFDLWIGELFTCFVIYNYVGS